MLSKNVAHSASWWQLEHEEVRVFNLFIDPLDRKINFILVRSK